MNGINAFNGNPVSKKRKSSIPNNYSLWQIVSESHDDFPFLCLLALKLLSVDCFRLDLFALSISLKPGNREVKTRVQVNPSDI